MKNSIVLSLVTLLSLTACSKFNSSPEEQFDKFRNAAKEGDAKSAFSYLFDPEGRRKERLEKMSAESLAELKLELQSMYSESLESVKVIDKECFLTEEEIEKEGFPKYFEGVCTIKYEFSDLDVEPIAFIYFNDHWGVVLPF